MAHHHGTVTDMWQPWTRALDRLFVFTAMMRILTLSIAIEHEEAMLNLFRAYQIGVALIGGLVCILTMKYFSKWRSFGILVTIVQNMFVDMYTWIVIFLITMIAFSLTLLGFERAGWYNAGQGKETDRLRV